MIDFELVLSYISVFITLYIFWATPKYGLLKDRYEKLVFPLFDYLEPHLFKEYNQDCTEYAIRLFKSHKQLASTKLIETAYYLESSPCQETYNKFCKTLIREYDFLCLRLGLKPHGILYRINRDQYKTKFMFFLYAFSNVLVLLIVELIMVYALLSLPRLLLQLFPK